MTWQHNATSFQNSLAGLEASPAVGARGKVSDSPSLSWNNAAGLVIFLVVVGVESFRSDDVFDAVYI